MILVSVNLHLTDAVSLLKLAKIHKALGQSEMERLFSTSAIVNAFQATEAMLNIYQERFFALMEKGNDAQSKYLSDLLQKEIKKTNPMKDRWKMLSKYFGTGEVRFDHPPFSEYDKLINFRNHLLHARIVRLEKGTDGTLVPQKMGDIGKFPENFSDVRSDHAELALDIVGRVIESAMQIFNAPYLTSAHQNGRLMIRNGSTVTPFIDAFAEAKAPLLSEELDLTLLAEDLRRILGKNADECIPPEAVQSGHLKLRLTAQYPAEWRPAYCKFAGYTADI